MSYWQDKTVCVTGGAGFVGVHLVGELLKAGADVTVLDDFSRGQNELSGAKYIRGDATLMNTCEYAFRGNNVRGEPVDVVFNLAASVAGVLHNQSHHHDMFLDNVNLQVVPLAAAEKVGVHKFVQISSVCVYAPGAQNPATEHEFGMGHILDLPHVANAGYSWSKRMGEHAAWWSNHKNISIVRPTNMFGPHDYFDGKAHVIPAMIRKFLGDDPVHLYGKQEIIREFLYVEDAVKGMMAAGEYQNLDGAPRAFLLGGGPWNQISMGGLSYMIREETLDGPEQVNREVIWHTGQGGGDPIRKTSAPDTHKLLNWRSETSLRDGIKETVAWYKKNR